MSASIPSPSQEAQDIALDIDVRCALAFGRAALRALAVISPETYAELDNCLKEEAAAAELQATASASAVCSILEQMRVELSARRDQRDRTVLL